MNKQEFLVQLRKGLSGLPQRDTEERLAFYGEMIDDRMEEGLSEEEAVSAVGSVPEIVAQVIADIPLTKIAKERIKPKRRLGAGEIVLLVLGSPIWLSLAVAAFAVILSVYVVLWSVIISLWTVWGSLIGGAFGGTVAGIVFACGGNVLIGIAMLDLSVSTGNVTVSNVTCEGDVKINVSTGKTNLTDIKCQNFISGGSTGGLTLKNVIATERFSIERNTGDVEFDGSDAAEIFVETDTGDVTGSLLTDKVFVVETDTGSMDVPRTVTGGRCEITTDTGDIRIKIQK